MELGWGEGNAREKAMETIKYVNISLELFGGFLSLVIVFSLILTGFEKNQLNRRFIRMLICNTAVLVSDAVAWLLKGSPDLLNFYAVRIANFCVYFFGYILLALFTDYLVSYIAMKAPIGRTAPRFMWGLCAIACLLVVVSQFNDMYYRIDEYNMYQRQDWFWLSQIWAIICMAIDAVIIIKYRESLNRREQIALASYIVLPVVAMTIQIFVYGIALLYLSTSISALCIYMGLQVEQAHRFQERELELEKSRTQVMLSQIQPHFLFNSLASICYLCRTDPAQAEKAVVEFSSYLRGNIDALSTVAPIAFTQEMEHLKHYLEIEKMRYGKKLNVIYDIQASAFKLPCLTVQPIVENAVKYGVGKRSEGGTIWVSVKEADECFLITVKDDGPGFDVEGKLEEDRAHVGINNVRTRLYQQCGGTLLLESRVGEGTTVLMKIPKVPEAVWEREKGL